MCAKVAPIDARQVLHNDKSAGEIHGCVENSSTALFIREKKISPAFSAALQADTLGTSLLIVRVSVQLDFVAERCFALNRLFAFVRLYTITRSI